MTTHRLRDVALVLTSNVDKVIDPNERTVRLCNYVDVYKNNFIRNDMPFKPGSATAAEIKKFGVQVHDVIITKDSETADEIGVPALVKSTAEDLVCGYHLSILRADRRRMIGPFLYWHLLSKKSQEDFGNAANGVTRFGLTLGGIKGIPVNVPDLATQRQIADFLDRETARIDLLIKKKQRLVALLAGKKETLLDTAVCKGLSDTAEKKRSGVDWFGDVPANWTVCRFNRLIASKVDYRGRTPEKVDEGVFLVTARNVRDGKIDYQRSEEYTTVEDWEKLSARGKPRIGDVLFTTEAPLGQVAQVDRTDVAFAQRIMKFRANAALVSNDFLALFMISASFQRSLQLFSSGSTAAGIKSERLAHLFGLVPPELDQAEIVAFVRRQIDHLDALEAPINASIDRLKEYRSALITAAVTGQIDVDTYTKSGTPDRHLDAIQEEMGA
ncbi:restriction endonuclease subunit S [Roseovarius tibetensis]|uniref:restriction endonuclease subunit S n=1 Tax=Roseovarius tibetensis TaxID=2685897 RepID=UPI003D7F5C2D